MDIMTLEKLNYNELREVGLESSELVVYGHVPMMVSAQCVTKTVSGCRKEKGILVMKDRYQKEFFVKNNCDYCYNFYNYYFPLHTPTNYSPKLKNEICLFV